MKRFLGRLGSPLELIFFLVVIWLALRPLGLIFWSAVRSGSPGSPRAAFSFDGLVETYGSLVTGGRFLRVTLISLALALTVTVIALVVGGAVTWLATRTDMPGRNVLMSLLLVPIFFSSLLGIIGWEFLFARRSGLLNVAWTDLTGGPLFDIYSYSGIVFVMAGHLIPYAILILYGPMRNADTTLEEAAEVAGSSRWQVFRTVSIPLLTPAFAAASLFIFVLSLEIFTIPHILGGQQRVETLASYIYLNTKGFSPNYSNAAAGGTVLLAIALIALYLHNRVRRRTGRYVTIGARGSATSTIRMRGRWRWLATGSTALVVLVVSVLPLVAVAVRSLMSVRATGFDLGSLGFDGYREIFDSGQLGEALGNSAVVAIGGALVIVAFSLAVGVRSMRRRSYAITGIDYGLSLPVAVPGVLFGLGCLLAYVTTPIYATVYMLLVALAIKFFGIGVQSVSASLSQLDPALREAGSVSGATTLTATRTITVPLLLPALASVWLLLFLAIVREVSASAMLYIEGTRTLPLLTWDFMTDGYFGVGAAVSVVQVVFIAVVIVMWRITTRGDIRSAVTRYR